MKSSHRYVAIMAGGVGSRFWPSSREARPKQFLDITGDGSSLLQQTVDRVLKFVSADHIYIVSNLKYADQILEQLPMLTSDNLLLEPTRNNTAPCVAYTALHLQAKDEDAVFAMLPADHIIADEEAFAKAMIKGYEKAESENAIVTLGIQPTRPDTGYGYINYDGASAVDGIYKVNSFKEKPSKDVAEQYLADGGYVWNGGIFIWSSKTIIGNFLASSPQIIEVLSKDPSKYNTDQEQAYINEVYPLTDKISVDYAILESATNVFTIPVDLGWSDLGTWGSLYAYLDKDEHNNVILAKENEILSSNGNLIKTNSDKKLVVIKGLKDFIVIDEDDVLLIYPRAEEQDIKKLRAGLQNKSFE